MQTRLGTTYLLAAVFLLACSGIRVSQDYDPTTDFSRYRTFAWAPEPVEKSGDLLLDSPLMDRRIRSAVENTLAANGYRKATDRQPDFFVTYHLAVRTRIEADTFGPGIGWYGYPYYYRGYPYWGDFGYDTVIREYEEGTLIIDFTDAISRKLTWRGIGTRRIQSHSTPEKTTESVNNTVAEILAQFPPLPDGG